jgi:hypothetical protein
MITSPAIRLVYADTQSLIYAYEKAVPAWVNLFEQYFAMGYRLALTEENIFEFAQSPTLQSGLSLTRRIVELHPVWLRSFIDIQADEVRNFVERQGPSNSNSIVKIYRDSFEAVSQIGERHQLDPIKFVEAFSSEKAQNQIGELRLDHVRVLNTLSQASASGELTKGHLELAFHHAISERLKRGSDLTEPLSGTKLDDAIKFCIKNRRWLLRECPSFAVEEHLSNYRSASPKRNARPSDSVDLTAMVAALPYVDTVITNDGFLYGGLEYVKKKIPTIKATLVRAPTLINTT